MKKIILLLVMFNCFTIFSQQTNISIMDTLKNVPIGRKFKVKDNSNKTNEYNITKNLDSLTMNITLSDELKYLPIGTFKKTVSKYFSKLVTGQTTSGVGNYASLNIGKTDVTIAPSYLFNNGNIFALKINGGITDGISSLFSNSKLNSNISIDAQYHFLTKARTIVYDKFIFDEYNSKIKKARTDGKIEEVKYYLDWYNIDCKKKKDSINKLLKDHNKKIDSLKNLISPLDTISDKCKITEYRMELLKEIKQTKTCSEALLALQDLSMRKNLLQLNNKRIQKINDLKDDFQIKRIMLSWFTLSAKLKNDAFRLLDEAEIYDKQVKKVNYVSYEFKTQYNYFIGNVDNSKDDETFLLSTSLTYKNKSNFDDLDKNEITETKTIGSDASSIRESKKSYIAYTGIYEKGINQMDFDADLYYYFKSNEIFGIHLFPKSTFTENLKPQYNFGLGFIVPFKNTEKENSIINVEVYYNFLDVFNSLDSAKNLWQRNDIGLRFTFPFNF